MTDFLLDTSAMVLRQCVTTLKEQARSGLAAWVLWGLILHVLVFGVLKGIELGKSLWHAATRFWGENSPCPRRRARWEKCLKRCEKRCAKQTPEEECCLTKCAMNLIKCHLPPPLPLKQKKKRDKKRTVPEEALGTAEEDRLTVHKHVGHGTETEAQESAGAKEPSGVVAIQNNVSMGVSDHPMTPLIDLARMQYWDALLKQVNKRGARYRDSDGLFPLHWACSGGPPTQVIHALIDVYPSASRKVDKEGSTALHFATHYSASLSVVQTVLSCYPQAAHVQDRYGRTPLYHAVEKSAGKDTLEVLIEQNPNAILTPCLHKQQRDVPMSRAVAQRTPLYMAWSVVLLDPQTRRSRRGRKWEKATLLLRAAYNHMSQKNLADQGSYNLVSAAIALDLYLPEDIVPMMVSVHPELLTRANLTTGRLPIMEAAAAPMVSRQRSDSVLAALLQANPMGAHARDKDGKSALQLALESGKPWSAGVERLFDANPEATRWNDASGLYPALAAATVPVSEALREENVDPGVDENPLGLLSPKCEEAIRRRRLKVFKPTIGEGKMTETEHIATILHVLQADPSVLAVGHSRS